jgi:hypothetical protein
MVGAKTITHSTTRREVAEVDHGSEAATITARQSTASSPVAKRRHS